MTFSMSVIHWPAKSGGVPLIYGSSQISRITLSKPMCANIATAVNPFDNVILEICDEPYINGTPPDLAGQWIADMLKVIHETENGLPKWHLVAQQVEGLNGPCDFADDPRISLITASTFGTPTAIRSVA